MRYAGGWASDSSWFGFGVFLITGFYNLELREAHTTAPLLLLRLIVPSGSWGGGGGVLFWLRRYGTEMLVQSRSAFVRGVSMHIMKSSLPALGLRVLPIPALILIICDRLIELPPLVAPRVIIIHKIAPPRRGPLVVLVLVPFEMLRHLPPHPHVSLLACLQSMKKSKDCPFPQGQDMIVSHGASPAS
jgi:hypothetical protein